jgi:hypothetical protein
VHFFVCADCATLLQHTAEYVDAMRTAAGKLRKDAQQPASYNAGDGSR